MDTVGLLGNDLSGDRVRPRAAPAADAPVLARAAATFQTLPVAKLQKERRGPPYLREGRFADVAGRHGQVSAREHAALGAHEGERRPGEAPAATSSAMALVAYEIHLAQHALVLRATGDLDVDGRVPLRACCARWIS